MGKLIRYSDGKTCWSHVDLENGDPILIRVGPMGVMVKKSRLGVIGGELYHETNVQSRVTAACLLLNSGQYRTPKEMTTLMLRVFTQVALECTSATELTIRLKNPFGLQSTDESPVGRGPTERREQVIEDFKRYVEHHAIGADIRDVSELPHPKKEILDAIKWKMVLDTTNAKSMSALSNTAILLPNFQEHVGAKTLTPFGITAHELRTWNESHDSELDEQKIQKVRAYLRSPDKAKYDSFDQMVQQEQQDIGSALKDIEACKRDFLENT